MTVQEKLVAKIACDLEKQESELRTKDGALEATEVKVNRLAGQNSTLEMQLKAVWENARNAKRHADAATLAVRTDNNKAITVSETKVRTLKDALDTDLTKLVDTVLQQLVSDFAEQYKLKPLIEPLAKIKSLSRKDTELIHNYLLAIFKNEKIEKSLVDRNKYGSIALAVTVFAHVVPIVVHLLETALGQEIKGLKMAPFLMALVTFVISPLLVFFAVPNHMDARRYRKDLLDIEIERKLTSAGSNTAESKDNLGETKEAAIRAAALPAARFMLASMLMKEADSSITNGLFHGVTQQIVEGLEGASQLTLPGGQDLDIQADALEKLISIAREKVSGLVKSKKFKGPQLHFIMALESFLKKNQEELEQGFELFFLSIAQKAVEALRSDDTLVGKIEEIEVEEEYLQSLKTENERLTSGSTTLVDTAEESQYLERRRAELDSSRKKKHNLEKQRGVLQEKYNKTAIEFNEASTAYAASFQQVEAEKIQMEDLELRLERSKTVMKDVKGNIQQLEKKISTLKGNEKKELQRIQSDPLVTQLITPKAFVRVIERHLDQTDKSLLAHKREHGYGANFLGLDTFLETLVAAHRSYKAYTQDIADTNQASIPDSRDLYVNCDKKIGTGFSVNSEAEQLATGASYSMDQQGRITHIHPFLPRRSPALNDALQSRGQV